MALSSSTMMTLREELGRLAKSGRSDFDAAGFLAVVDALRQEKAKVEQRIEPNRPGDVLPLPAADSPQGREGLRRGEEALRRGELALVIVAGGAGTRFGGAVKGLVPVTGGHTFLDFKLADARAAARRFGRPVPVALMTSELTHAEIAKTVAGASQPLFLFQQRMLPRLTTDWRLYHGPDGQPSWAPAGHGDFYRVLRASGVGAQLRRMGVRHLAFSNVDNLAATVDAGVLGFHLEQGADATVEVTSRQSPSGALDTGAAPVRINGHLQLMEKADPARYPVISTNNILFRLDALLDQEISPPFRAVKKTVDDAEVLQLEQVTAEATSLLDGAGRPVLSTRYLEVPRTDPMTSRFEPVKLAEDLPQVARRLERRLEAIWAES